MVAKQEGMHLQEIRTQASQPPSHEEPLVDLEGGGNVCLGRWGVGGDQHCASNMVDAITFLH